MISIWLEPDDAGRKILDSLVSIAHHMVGGPLVVPHVTVRGSLEIEPGEASALLKTLASGGPLELSLEQVKLGTIWNKALYATASGSGLVEMRSALDSFLDLGAEEYEPHVSFAYGSQAIEKRKEAGSTIARSLPLGIRFTTITAWSTPAVDENDVPDWFELERVDL